MDQAIFHLINEHWANPALDLFMAALSDSEIWKPLLIIIVLIGVIFGGFKARVCILCILLSVVVAEQCTGILKSAVGRHRPKQMQGVRMVELQKARPKFLTLFKVPTVRYSDQSDRNKSGPSFPSGHMTNNTVVAVCLTLFYRRRGWLYWIVAAAVGYSRVYLGAHWPSDIIETLFLATGEALLLLALFELIWRWIGRKWAPEIFQKHPSLLADDQARSPGASQNSQVGRSRHAK